MTVRDGVILSLEVRKTVVAGHSVCSPVTHIQWIVTVLLDNICRAELDNF